MNFLAPDSTIDPLYTQLKNGPLMILESQLKGHPSSGKSFIAARPGSSLTVYGSRVEWEEDGKKQVFKMNPWDALKEFRSSRKKWLFGFLGYDLKNFIEDLHSRNAQMAEIPDMYFMEPEILLKVEHDRITTIAGEIVGIQDNGRTRVPGNLSGKLSPMVHKDDYCRNVNRIQELIHEGLFYELNYTFPMIGSYFGDPYWLYTKMREINPVPFGAFISAEKFSVSCASPERFLHKQGNLVQSEPIKGTAARASTHQMDTRQKEELLNEKNRAENLMIVDLVRHDLSKVSIPGSVKVTNLYDIQTFGTVHQLISTVESKVSEDVDPVDIIKNCFPMGSMTGAPKIEVMKTIDKLEIYRRGIYSGAIGYFAPDGDFDFNVVIRTAIMQDQSLYYPVGGAITSDSNPELEWEESMIKSKSITEIF